MSECLPGSVNEGTREMLLRPVRESSAMNYERKWADFVCWLKSSENRVDSVLSRVHVLNYFGFLAGEKSYSYKSLMQVRSALRRPLRWLLPEFRLSDDECISDIIQYAKSHPKRVENMFPCWDVDKVLGMLSSELFLQKEKSDMSLLLGKVIFLCALASPKRSTEFLAASLARTVVTDEGACIRTHNKFMPKNFKGGSVHEIWVPKLNDRKLCPVYYLKSYIRLSRSWSRIRSDRLWVDVNGAPLSRDKLRKCFREIIFAADPSAVARGATFHSVRSVASSILDYRGCSLKVILEQMNWASDSVFLGHYAKLQIQNHLPCVAAGVSLPNLPRS